MSSVESRLPMNIAIQSYGDFLGKCVPAADAEGRGEGEGKSTIVKFLNGNNTSPHSSLSEGWRHKLFIIKFLAAFHVVILLSCFFLV